MKAGFSSQDANSIDASAKSRGGERDLAINALPEAELCNLAKLNRFILVYAMLAPLSVVLIMALMIVLGQALDGDFGAIALARVLLRIFAVVALLLCAYVVACYVKSPARVSRWMVLKLMLIAIAYTLVSVPFNSAGDFILVLLSKLGEGCNICDLQLML